MKKNPGLDTDVLPGLSKKRVAALMAWNVIRENRYKRNRFPRTSCPWIEVSRAGWCTPGRMDYLRPCRARLPAWPVVPAGS